MKPECAHTDLVALTLLVQQPTDALKLLHAPNPRYLPASRRMPGNASSTITRIQPTLHELPDGGLVRDLVNEQALMFVEIGLPVLCSCLLDCFL
jgi:hypothetical protein